MYSLNSTTVSNWLFWDLTVVYPTYQLAPSWKCNLGALVSCISLKIKGQIIYTLCYQIGSLNVLYIPCNQRPNNVESCCVHNIFPGWDNLASW